jgi:hypothetical protein
MLSANNSVSWVGDIRHCDHKILAKKISHCITMYKNAEQKDRRVYVKGGRGADKLCTLCVKAVVHLHSSKNKTITTEHL